jgi:ATP-binding cassette subfamily G (WHITE) protein 2
MEWLAQCGYPCPPFTNPADHLLDLLKENESKLPLFMTSVVQSPYASPRPSVNGEDIEAPFTPPTMLPSVTLMKKKSWGQKFVILLRRSLQEQLRNKTAIAIQIVQTICMAVLIGTVFLRIGKGQSSVVRRGPVLFFCAVNQGMFGAMTVINLFPAERVLMLRERAAGTYPVSAYLLARSLAETVMQIVSPIVFTLTVYWLVGFQSETNKFFIFLCFMILCSLAATSMALFISAVCRTTALSVVVLPMALELCRLFGAFFLSPANLPKYFKWLDAMSYVKYTYVGVALNEMSGLVLTCTEAQKVKGNCPVPTGETTIRLLGLNNFTIGGCFAGLIVIILVTRIGTYLGLRFIKW